MAAAPDESDSVTEAAPALSRAVELALRETGEHAELLLDSVVQEKLFGSCAAARHVRNVVLQQQLLACCLLLRPLQRAVLTDRPGCPCCPLRRLLVLREAVSGSMAEGLGALQRTAGDTMLASASDKDLMLELGHVRWVSADAGPTDPGRGCCESCAARPTPAPRLAVTPTARPGFVRLLRLPEPGCSHRERRPLHAGDVRAAMRDLWPLLHGAGEWGASGPATSHIQTGQTTSDFTGVDFVACLRLPLWPSDEFFRRQRTCDWPPAAAREDVRRFGLHVVPVGARGSDTEQEEWRLSFSRAEVVAAYHLSDIQRGALISFKACKAALGSENTGVKSYFIKTALFWLCQEVPAEQWKSISQGMWMLLDFLEKAVADRRLACFFCADINLLWQSTEDELQRMAATLAAIRQHRARLLASEIAANIEQMAPELLALGAAADRLSERQLRVFLARRLMVDGLISCITRHAVGPLSPAGSMTVTLLLAGATDELALLSRLEWCGWSLQGRLLQALLLAPADAVGPCRLRPLGDGRLVWDAAPLLALLTAADLRRLLLDPAAVHAWCRAEPGRPDLSSARGRADLLLDPPLLLRALTESGALGPAVQQRLDRAVRRFAAPSAAGLQRFDVETAVLERDAARWRQRVGRLQCAPDSEQDRQRSRTLRLLRRLQDDSERFFGDPDTRAEYEAIRASLSDPWLMRPYVFSSGDRSAGHTRQRKCAHDVQREEEPALFSCHSPKSEKTSGRVKINVTQVSGASASHAVP